MRKLKLYIAASLDGKIARKDDSIDWLPDPTTEDYGYKEFYDSIDTTVMGHKTYEVCLGLGDWYYKDKVNFVFSRNSERNMIPEAQLINRSPVDFVKELKQQEGKDIWLLGGGEIVRLLHDAGLVDEYIIAYIPIILGEGILLFPEIQQQKNLTLTQHRVFSNGVVMLYLE